MEIEVNWKIGLNFQNPFKIFGRLDQIHDYVWEGEDEDDE
jgi:hypothetical protein